MKRRLRTSVALVVAAALVAIFPAPAQGRTIGQAQVGVRLYTAELSSAYTNAFDGRNSKVRLLAGVDDSLQAVAGVRFSYLKGATQVNIGNATITDGVAIGEWTAPSGAEGAAITALRAEVVSIFGNVIAVDTNAVAGTATPNVGAGAVSIDAGLRESVGVSPDGEVVISGKTHDQAGAVGEEFASTVVTNRGPVANGPGSPAIATGEVDAFGLTPFAALVPVAPANLTADPEDEIVVQARIFAEGDENQVVRTYHQQVRGFSQRVADGFPTGGQSRWVLAVKDQRGQPVSGVNMYESDAVGRDLPGAQGMALRLDGAPLDAGESGYNGELLLRLNSTGPYGIDGPQDQDPTPGKSATYVVIDVNQDGNFDNGLDVLLKIPFQETSSLLGDINKDGRVRVAILGDSYISGEGAADGIEAGKDPDDPNGEQPMRYHNCTDLKDSDNPCPTVADRSKFENQCHRSDASWGMRVAKTTLEATPRDLLFAACSGAKTEDIDSHGQFDGKGGRKGPSPFGVFGGEPQLKALRDFQNGAPPVDVVLMSIGGNDTGFGEVIAACFQSNCRKGTMAQSMDIYHSIARDDLADLVAYTLKDVESVARNAQVLIAEYPDAIDRTLPGCGSLVGFNAEELKWLETIFLPEINDAIREAASRTNALVVPFEDSFVGHEICSDVPYLYGLRPGNDAPFDWGPFGAESFHPNAYGHRRLAKDAVLHAISSPDFGHASWDGSPLPKPPPPRSELVVISSDGSASTTPGGELVLQGSNLPLQGGRVVMNSLPTSIGTWQSDATGKISVKVEVPRAAAPGGHSLILFTHSGSAVATGNIFVDTSATCPATTSEPDVDGDGMPDTCDPAPHDGPLADADGDGVANDDDNCPALRNPGQEDANGNGLGALCDPAEGGDLDATLVDPVNQAPRAPTLTLKHRHPWSTTVRVRIQADDPDDADEVLVHRCSLDGGEPRVCQDRQTFKDLSIGRHTVAVTTGDPAGSTSPSSSVTFAVTKASRPGRVTRLKASIKGPKAVLRWRPGKVQGPKITGFRIKITRADGPAKIVVTKRSRLVLRQLKPGRYRWQVWAVNDVGRSAPSARRAFTVVALPHAGGR